MQGFLAVHPSSTARSGSLVSYLERFWKSLCATFLRLDWIPRSVSPSERISRFILDKRYIKKGLVSSAAFMPSPKTKDISVYRIAGCSERRIWLIGDLFVARKRKDNRNRILARADVESGLVFQQGLKIVASLSPHPRHADVTNWPDDRAQQKDKAVTLAQGASLR